jgi:hypothetical protein
MRYIPATRETVKAYPRSHSRSPFETMARIPALRRKPPNHKIAQIAVPPSLSIMMFSMVQSFSPCMPQTSVPRNFFAAIRRPERELGHFSSHVGANWSAARRLPGIDGGFASNVCKLTTIKAIASLPRHFQVSRSRFSPAGPTRRC